MSDLAAQATCGFEPARLERFLRDRLPGLRGPMLIEPIGVRYAGEELALR